MFRKPIQTHGFDNQTPYLQTLSNHRPVERYYLSLSELQAMERDILVRRHVERYAMTRQHLYGSVLDLACGAGYGSYLASKNPDVLEVMGVDVDQEAINHANSFFKTKKTKFIVDCAEGYTEKHDCLVCLETIEHIKDTTVIPLLADRCKVELVILSYPSKKTTHYNPFHCHDFCLQDIVDLFVNFQVVDTRDLHGEVMMVFLMLTHGQRLRLVR